MNDNEIADHRLYLAREALNAYCNARCTITAPGDDALALIVDLVHLIGFAESPESAMATLDIAKCIYGEDSANG